MSDVVGRAKAVLENVPEDEWTHVGGGHVQGRGGLPIAKVWGMNKATFIAAARTVVPELVAEVEILQDAAKTLGRIILRHNQVVLDITGLHSLVDESGDGAWDVVWERLAEMPAEIERLRAAGPWVEHVERQRAMKRERDGECICNTGPNTGGPEEGCPWHGREYRYRVDGVAEKATEIERLQAQLLLPHLYPCVCTRNTLTGETLDYDCGREIERAKS